MGFLDDILDEATAYRHVDQNSDEWYEVRSGKFTASKNYRLMGEASREMTPDELAMRPKSGTGSRTKKIIDADILSDTAINYVYEKVAERLTGHVKDETYAYAAVYGKEMEPRAIEYFIDKTGLVYTSVGFIGYGEHAGGSPDGLIGDDAILEIKCPATIDKQVDYLMLKTQQDIKDRYPDFYWQCMNNMLFSGRDKCHFVTFDPRYKEEKHKMVHIEILPVEEDLELTKSKIKLAVDLMNSVIKQLTE